MPNWCENALTIHCAKTQVKAMKEKLISIDEEKGRRYLDFNQLIPMPKPLSETVCTRLSNYQLLQIKPTKRFRFGEIKRFIRLTEQKRIRVLAKQCRWTIARFLRWLEKRPAEQDRLGFNLPLAKQYADNMAQFGYTDWYNWSYDNWGCKWNVNRDSCSVSISDDGFLFIFDTPWGPPEEWFRTLCQTFPDVDMRLAYFEPGCWFAGEFISDTDGGYSYSPMESDDDIREFASREFGWEPYEEE